MHVPTYTHAQTDLSDSSLWCDLHSFQIAKGSGDPGNKNCILYKLVFFYTKPHISFTVHMRKSAIPIPQPVSNFY